jgi:hypothetical protein|tara:strand:+ start:869 stop:1492 length:624 start_codon:yes stop_codon:yes gene_type:complete
MKEDKMTINAAQAEPPNIYKRILAVMAEVYFVQKEDRKVNKQYTFVSHDAVTAKLHPQFVKHGIVVVPSVMTWSVNGNRTEVYMSVAFVNADNPDDRITLESLGFGIDQQDKGPGKAISYAYKYALLKLFALETGDDPERDDIDHQKSLITAEQKDTIISWLQETNSDIPKFLEYMEVASVDEIPAGQYNNAIIALKSKKKQDGGST